MAEELIVQANQNSDLKLVIMRPSIIMTGANEPIPGWTDTKGLIQGVALLIGLGIFKDCMGNPNGMADIIPVDFVCRQILLSIPYVVQRGEKLLVSHCCSSNINPNTWEKFFLSLTEYQNNFPYDNRAGEAVFRMHTSASAFRKAHKYRNELPAKAFLYYSKVFGSKKKKQQATELQSAVKQCVELSERFKYFTCNEWVFNSDSVHKMNAFLNQSKQPQQISEFELNQHKLNWHNFAMNCAYGIKCYILKEECSLPSMGYNDVVQRMVKLGGRDLLPWNQQGLPIQPRSQAEYK